MHQTNDIVFALPACVCMCSAAQHRASEMELVALCVKLPVVLVQLGCCCSLVKSPSSLTPAWLDDITSLLLS